MNSPEGNNPKLSILHGFQMLSKAPISFKDLGREKPERSSLKHTNARSRTSAMYLALAVLSMKSWQEAANEKEEESAGAKKARH